MSLEWLKRIWLWFTAERVQAIGTSLIALVTVWTLFLTPLGERLVSKINQDLWKTQQEVERNRKFATKWTLLALWKEADDRLVENEYFANIAQDYGAHTKWVESGEKLIQGPKGRNNPSPGVPSTYWLRVPAREGKGNFGAIPLHEKGRWGKRMNEILPLWRASKDSAVDLDVNFRELRKILDHLLETHFSDNGYGAPRTGRALIDEMKADDTVEQLGSTGSESVRETLDRFLHTHPNLASATIRVQFDGPYTKREVIEMGREITENVTCFRDALRSFIEAELGPHFH